MKTVAQNKALVLEALDMLFNRRDYEGQRQLVAELHTAQRTCRIRA